MIVPTIHHKEQQDVSAALADVRVIVNGPATCFTIEVMRLGLLTVTLLVAWWLAAPTGATATTWLVRPDGSGDAPTIQAAVDSAAAFQDTVLLAPGTYTGAGNRGIDFSGKALVMRSLAGPEVTIIDCEQQDRGVSFQSDETPSTVLAGVTIINGDPGKSAGAIFCSGASPTIDDCILRDNTADAGSGAGGALFCVDFADPTVTNTRFTNNRGGNGGAVWCGQGAEPVFIDCIFDGNTASQNGGAFACVSFGRPTVINCTIANNTALNFGSALYSQNASPYFIQTIVTADDPASLIYCDVGAAPSFTCCNIFGDITGGYAPDLNGGDNVFTDPLFCGVDGSGNYFLQSGSPCTADNSPCGALIGALPVACGTSPSEPRTWGGTKHIFRHR